MFSRKLQKNLSMRLLNYFILIQLICYITIYEACISTISKEINFFQINFKSELSNFNINFRSKHKTIRKSRTTFVVPQKEI